MSKVIALMKSGLFGTFALRVRTCRMSAKYIFVTAALMRQQQRSSPLPLCS